MRPTLRSSFGCVVVCATVVGALAGSALAAARAGDKAPAFSLKSVDKGEARSLTDAGKGKLATVVFFHSARCPVVKESRPVFAELVKAYSKKVAFVGVNSNQNEPVDEVKQDAEQNFAGITVLKDEASRTADAFEANHTPEVFVVDAAGVVRYHGSFKELGTALGEITAGKPISRSEVKALGCTIKRKP